MQISVGKTFLKVLVSTKILVRGLKELKNREKVHMSIVRCERGGKE